MVIPMITIALISSSCISIAPESVAGEKERGTIGLVLIAPIKKSEIALSKIISFFDQ